MTRVRLVAGLGFEIRQVVARVRSWITVEG